MDDKQGIVPTLRPGELAPMAAPIGPKYVPEPFVFRYKGGKLLRLCVIDVAPTNHQLVIGLNPEFATDEHLRFASLKHGVRARVEESVIADATAPNPGTADWERERANRAEAQLRLIETLVLANGGFGYVQAQHGNRRETIPEAVARMCKQPEAPQLEAPKGPGLVLDIDR